MGSDDVRRAAARVQQMADDVRGLADRALGAGSVQWRSTAATEFRERLAEQAARGRSSAAVLDHAAEALRHHALAVDGFGHWFGLGGDR
jgi:hypothetical protein